MDKVCQYCHALKFRNEAAGMCCASGKVVLSPLPAPPEPLLSLLTGNSDDSKLFLQDHNQLIQLIKRVSPRLQNDNYQIVIKADKVPLGEHAGRFNAPTVDEVAVIMVGDPVDKRSIKITRRDNTISTISDLHRSYDALQYPLIFWQGQDEYHLNIKQYDPNTGDYRNNKVSSMNYYAHRIMVRQHQDNYILRYRQLFHQYIVDMYAKVESERLRFLRFNQAKLRSEEYIHLRDAVAGNIDGNLNPNDIGNAFILPSSYIGSPRNMQEYMQDAMTYVRHYGRPDLFITFTCNPNWEEIQTLLLPGQQAIHRHDLTARVFKQKLKSLIDFIVKYSIFGITRCWLYTIEWQKRGLPHAHILVWLKDRIRPEEIDQIISAEIPDPLIDQELFDIVTKHMIHGPCGAFNMTSPCMENGKYPAVKHLAIHLENGQRVYFTEENVLQRAFEAPKTTLTEFFTLCQKPDVFGQFAKTLVYGDVPRYFTWNKSSKKWEPRKQGKPHPSITGIFKAKTLGRLYTVHPKQRECFYLRLLLVNVPGPTSFEFLRTVNGRVFNTYQDACRELQLLEDDNHWDLTLADAALTSTPNNIRQLFAIILTTCYPSQAQTLWEKYKNCMTEDILHRIRETNQSQNIDYTPEMYNEALVLIEDLCVLISNLPLNHYGMPSPNRPATDLVNTDLQRENQYDHGSLATIIMNSEPLLTAEQKIIYDRIMLAVAAEQGGFFLGCTRWNRHCGYFTGWWANSTFNIQAAIDVHNKPDAMCNIKKNSGIAAVLRKSSIIIWDECTMAHKYSLEALNRTMQDLNSINKLFGGAILLLSGDFRQTLPVIPRSTFADQINACLKQSFLWRSVETLRLAINMRVQLQNDPSAQIFSEQLLHIGNGKIELQLNTQCIKLPDNFCTVVQDKNELIQSIFRIYRIII
ncbi:ATP-dependent DNA helicase [Trichonephila clavipes]|uniref:ATP-dependent DNA helicase n=1 Tax=Trichonephila clavipes TaxID=2585209 RepID=A0A8X6SUV1_TRICX|nr:ATP-dependent DNA helicase [Trichonephila clavipes]